MFVARKAVFLEKEFIFKKNSRSKVQLEEILYRIVWKWIQIHKKLCNPSPLDKSPEGPIEFVTSLRDMDFVGILWH